MIKSPIGVFDSGYGGLTILSEIRKQLPAYDYIYLGDNARAPYGTRSFDLVYKFTLEAVKFLFKRGCHLVVLACNTASAKALRTIQQNDLPHLDPTKRVLGVIRPTVEYLGTLNTNGNIGIFATPGTIASKSYDLEIAKLYPRYTTTGQACAMWVPLIENNEHDTPGADFFISRDVACLLEKQPGLDAVILGCTHYPLIKDKIARYLPSDIKIVEQGEIVAKSLEDYLSRHPEIDRMCSKGGSIEYLTTEDSDRFDNNASMFLSESINSKHVKLK